MEMIDVPATSQTRSGSPSLDLSRPTQRPRLDEAVAPAVISDQASPVNPNTRGEAAAPAVVPAQTNSAISATPPRRLPKALEPLRAHKSIRSDAGGCIVLCVTCQALAL